MYDGRVVSLRLDTFELPDGKPFQREIVEHNGSVGIIPLTSAGGLVLVRQLRAPVGEALLEIPAGSLNKGEDPRSCAARELIEETSLKAGRLEAAFFAYLAPGYSTEGMHFFLARDLAPTLGQQDEDEDVSVDILPFEKALKMVLDGDIRDIKTIAGVLWAAKNA